MVEILIIDDNEAILHVLNKVLSKQGYQTTVAATGHEAIEKLSSKAFDIAIIDRNLPDIDGLALYKLITVRYPLTKKILLSGLPPEREDIESLGERARILIKPLPAPEIIQEIKQLLNQ